MSVSKINHDDDITISLNSKKIKLHTVIIYVLMIGNVIATLCKSNNDRFTKLEQSDAAQNISISAIHQKDDSQDNLISSAISQINSIGRKRSIDDNE